MLSTSSKSWGDVGDQLSDFFKAIHEKDRQEKVGDEVRALRQTLKSLKKTEEKLIKKLSEKKGTTGDERTDIDLDPQKAMLLESIKLGQKMDLYKICHSISGVKHDIVSGKLVLKFHPMFEGEMHGPYQVLLERTPHRTIQIHSFQMPIGGSFDPHPDPQFKQVNPNWKFSKSFKMANPYLVVPFEKLEAKYLDCENLSVRLFTLAVRKHLTSYVSRLGQVKVFQEKFGEQFLDLEFNDTVTSISFGLTIDDVAREESGAGKTITLRLNLHYDLDMDLPRPGSLSFRLGGEGANNLGEDGFDDLREQCQVFYSKRLEEAVNQAFGDV